MRASLTPGAFPATASAEGSGPLPHAYVLEDAETTLIPSMGTHSQQPQLTSRPSVIFLQTNPTHAPEVISTFQTSTQKVSEDLGENESRGSERPQGKAPAGSPGTAALRSKEKMTRKPSTQPGHHLGSPASSPGPVHQLTGHSAESVPGCSWRCGTPLLGSPALLSTKLSLPAIIPIPSGTPTIGNPQGPAFAHPVC